VIICDLCGHSDFITIGEERFKEITTSSESMEFFVCLVCCKRCGLVFQNPIQDEKKLQLYYLTMFREEGCRPTQYQEIEIMHRVDFLTSFRNPKIQQSVLEVGCADGTTLVNFRKRGLTVLGIEPSIENANICRRKNLEIFNCAYGDFIKNFKKLDFICSYYTMEHLTSPVNFLSFCNKLLCDNGIICIEIPDIEAYKKERITYDLLFFFEHQHHFTKETVKILLERCGFELLTFSERTTHDFGMHFAARKVSSPTLSEDLHIPNAIFDSVMREVTEYRNHFTRKLDLLKKTVQSIFINNKLGKKIVLCPASLGTKMLLELPEVNINLVKFIIDNSPDKWGRTLYGIQICSPKMLDSTVETIVVISSFSGEIKDQLLSMGINEKKIVIL
jgi:SAM-dependent methyltransferase